MTTDHDLLARIDSYYAYKGICHCDTEVICPCNKEFDPLIKALRAVVELHKPEQTNHPTWTEQVYGCGHCSDCGWQPYPCPTIQAIEKELG